MAKCVKLEFNYFFVIWNVTQGTTSVADTKDKAKREAQHKKDANPKDVIYILRAQEECI